MLSDIDGTIGLAPDLKGYKSILNQLYDQGYLTAPIISFQFNKDPLPSKVEIGTTNVSYYNGLLVKQRLERKFSDWWTVSLNNLYFGEDSIRTTAVTYAIVSTGTSWIQISKTDYTNFVYQIQNAGPNAQASLYCHTKLKTLFQNCFAYVPCSNFSSELKPLTIRLNNQDFIIPPEGYLIDNKLNHQCEVAVSYISDANQFYILGDTFLRNFYTVLNFDDYTVAFAVSSNAHPGTKIQPVLSGWIIFAYFILATIGVLVVCIGSCCLIRQCRLRREAAKLRRFYLLHTQESETASASNLTHDAIIHSDEQMSALVSQGEEDTLAYGVLPVSKSQRVKLVDASSGLL